MPYGCAHACPRHPHHLLALLPLSRAWAALGDGPQKQYYYNSNCAPCACQCAQAGGSCGAVEMGGPWPHAHHQRPVGPGPPQGGCQSPGDQPSPQQGNKACGAGQLRNNLFLRQ